MLLTVINLLYPTKGIDNLFVSASHLLSVLLAKQYEPSLLTDCT